MGKGGCMEIWDMGTGMIRAVLGCLCCLLCGGPILIIVGIVVLLAPNHFDEHTNEYKTAITTFKNTLLPVIEGSSGSVSSDNTASTNLIVTTQLVPITGVNKDKVEAFTTHYLASPQSLPFQRSGTISNVTNSDSSDVMASVTVPSVSSVHRTPTASPSCTSKSNCKDSDFQSWCTSNYGDGDSSKVAAVRQSSSRGYCSFYERIEYFCKPIEQASNGAWQLDASMSGCDYLTGNLGTNTQTGFSGQKYLVQSNPFSGSSAYSIPVQLRADNDPYIVASRITKGTFDFGLTKAQQRTVGLVLIAIGAVLLVCIIGALVLLYRMVHKDERSGKAVYGAFGRTYNPPAHQGGYQQYPPQQQQYPPQQQQYPPQQQQYPPQQQQYPPQQQQYPPQQQQYPPQQQQYPPPQQPYQQQQPSPKGGYTGV